METVLKSNRKSQELYEEACNLIPGGVNSPVRSHKAVNGKPLFISKAEGAYIFDVDGNKYIDFINSWGALILGHGNKTVIESIQKAVSSGISFGAPHEGETELARLIVNRIPSIQKVRLVNSGTEAVMTAIRLARAYTKRNKIIKFTGCYHGHSDSVLTKSGSGVATLGIPTSLGVTKNTASETISISYNDFYSTEIAFSKFPNEIAAIIVEPVVANAGVIEPLNGFLNLLRELTTKNKSLLIFDEVITGFRLKGGSAQTKYNISPDITTLGKIIGGGMPIGAVGGKNEIMSLLAPEGPVYQAGTLSGNPVSVAAGIATLKILEDQTIYENLENTTTLLCNGMNQINKDKNIKVRINRVDSMFSIFFNANIIHDFEEAQKSNIKLFAKFFESMLNNGINLAPSQFEANFLSCAHTKKDIEKVLEIYEKSASGTD